MYAERYYTGTSKIAAVNIAGYANGIARRANEIAKALHETDILRAAAAFEEARPWAHVKPPIAVPNNIAGPARFATD